MTEAEAVTEAEAAAEGVEGEGETPLTGSWATLWDNGGSDSDSDDLDSDDDGDGEELSQEVVEMIAKEKEEAQADIKRMQDERRRSMLHFKGIKMQPKSASLPGITRVNTTRSGQFAGFNLKKTKDGFQGNDRRLLALQELVSSEQDYVQDLRVIVNVRRRPVPSPLPCLSLCL